MSFILHERTHKWEEEHRTQWGKTQYALHDLSVLVSLYISKIFLNHLFVQDMPIQVLTFTVIILFNFFKLYYVSLTWNLALLPCTAKIYASVYVSVCLHLMILSTKDSASHSIAFLALRNSNPKLNIYWCLITECRLKVCSLPLPSEG